MIRVGVGLVHWPIQDRVGKIVATNITNLDVHDIARACRVLGVEKYYLIHPMQEQLMFVSRLLEHWRIGEGSRMNPMRRTALTMVETATNVEHALKQFGGHPWLIGTSARALTGLNCVRFRELGAVIRGEQPPPEGRDSVFILFGTGFGMTEELLRSCDAWLEPIKGATSDDYRHLSVRSAVSICLDRLISTW